MLRQRLTHRRQQGMALIVALVLLLVMTMVAVVAMRSTTLDLKMATNAALARRAFQASEAGRLSIGRVLSMHARYRGWPVTVSGGEVPAGTGFDLPGEVEVWMGGRSNPGGFEVYMGENGCIYESACSEYVQPAGVSTTRRGPDFRFRAEATGGTAGVLDPEDVYADVWVTRVGASLVPGSGAAQGSGTMGIGTGSAGAGAAVFLDIRSEGRTVGNASSSTGSDYRVLVRN